MNCLQKLCFRGGKYSYLLLLLFLWLGNSGAWATTYEKVTDNSQLEIGKNYLVVYENGTTGYVMGDVSNSYMSSVDVTITNNTITLSEEKANIIVLGGTSDGYTLKMSLDGNYLYYNSGTKLTTNATVNDNTKWTITFDNGNAKICNVKTTDRFVKLYTSNNTFRAYQVSTGEWVSLYKEKIDINYTVTIRGIENGTLTVKNGETEINSGDKVPAGTKLTIEATPNDGYVFENWQATVDGETETSYNATDTYTVNGDVEFTATFSEPTYYTVKIAEIENGTFTLKNGETEINSGDEVLKGTVLTIEATPNDGCKFVKWTAETDNGTKEYEEANGTYTVNSDVTFTAEFTEIPSFEVTIEAPENGTLIVKNGETEVKSGDMVLQGTELTIEVEPAEGYKFRNWQAVDGSTHTYTVNFTYTIKDHDVTFKANFDKVVYHTVTWSVNGVETTEEVEEGKEIEFNAPTENIPYGYIFKGWYASTYGPSDNAPEFVTSATINGDVTYYAVFAKQAGEGTETTTVELTNEQIKVAVDAASKLGAYYDNQTIGDWTGKFAYAKKTDIYALQINRNTNTTAGAYNSHLTTPAFSSSIKSVTVKATNGTSSGRSIYLCASNNLGVANESDAVGSGTLNETDGSITIGVDGDYTQLSIYSAGSAFYIESVKVTYGGGTTYYDYRTSVSTDPYIEADDVTYAANETSGEITYTIKNSTDQTLKASSKDLWISDVTVDAENSKVIFTMTENEETSQRVGTITLTYGGVSKDVTVTQGAAVAKYKVTIKTSEKGTLTVMNGDKEITDGTMVPVGTELTIMVTPNDGYKLVNWKAIVGDVEEEKTETSGTYIVEDNVTFEAIFDEIVYYTITWSINGIETTEDVEEDKDIVFNTPTENIPEGYVFKGWYDDTLEPQDNAPEYVTSATATADVTYYAVFAKSNGGGTETATLTASHTASSSYTDNKYEDNNKNIWEGFTTNQIVDKKPVIQLKSTGGSYLESPEFPGNITDIVLYACNSYSASRTFYIDSEKSSKGGDLGKVDIDANDKLTKEYSVIINEEKQPFSHFFINVSGALSFNYIKVTYSSEAFTDFRTSVTAPTTATITIAKACTNGEGTYYGTYSCGKAFVVPDDLIVSEISVIDKKLLVESYSTGAVVPANTGVMISAIEPGEYTVELSDETGTSVLGSDNMLYASGDNGITAEEMGDAHPDCIYYRLTMHKKVTLGYYWGAADGAAFALAANKAYLAVPTETAAKISGFNIGGGETTGIAGVETDGTKNGARKIYNLQGQRVSEPLASGLYIIDGRKVVVK